MKRISVCIVVLCAFFAPRAFAALTLRFTDTSVIATGVTAGGSVAFLATGREPASRWMREAAVISDHDRNGEAALELARVVPRAAIWIAVDMTSGEWVAQGSPGYEAQPMSLREIAKHDSGGQLRKLAAAVSEMDVLLVRPGEGVWRLYAARTSAFDESGPDERQLRIDVDRMTPMGDTAGAVHTVRPRDIVALIDPVEMRYAVVEVGR